MWQLVKAVSESIVGLVVFAIFVWLALFVGAKLDIPYANDGFSEVSKLSASIVDMFQARSAPECSAPEVQKMVRDSVVQEIRGNLSNDLVKMFIGSSILRDSSLSMTGIRTDAYDSDTGARQCIVRAVLELAKPLPITGDKVVGGDVKYTVELTDKPGEFLVTVTSGFSEFF